MQLADEAEATKICQLDEGSMTRGKRPRRQRKKRPRIRPAWVWVPRFESLEKRIVLDGRPISISPAHIDAAESAEMASGVDLLQLPHEELAPAIQPVYFHAGDFNGDGNEDLAVVSHQAVPGFLSIHIGNGTGDFDSPVYYSTAGDSARSLEVADFNGDGEQDIAVAHRDSSDVAVFLGNAAGTFQAAPVLYDVGSLPRMVLASDFNEDGHLDLVTANYLDQSITLWLGDGNGAFTTRTDFSTSPAGKFSNPRSMIVDDLNEDGHLDVAVSSSTGENPTAAENVSILMGDGAGSFAAATSIAWGPDNEYSLNLTSADLNLDGHVDLVTANYFGSSLSVLLGDGSGVFSGPQHIDLGDEEFEPRYVTTGDFDLDGIPDLAVADSIVVRIGILRGDGSGGFGPRQDYELLPPGTLGFPLSNASLVVSDFDNDGDSDLAAVRDFGSFSVLLNRAEQPIVSVSASDPNAAEPDDDGQFTISRTGDVSEALTVQLSVAGTAVAGEDYVPLPFSLIIPSGSSSVILPVNVIDDVDAELDESVAVSLAAAADYRLSVDSTATVVISSDEQLPVVQIVASDAVAGEPNDNGQMTITRTGETGGPLTVLLSVSGTAAPGSDYQTLSTSVVIPAGMPSVELPVTVIDDSTQELVESVVVTLLDDAAYATGLSVTATVAITDNDTLPIPVEGLLAHWALDETGGLVAADDSGNSNDAMLDGATWTTGTINGGLDFDGIDDSVDAGLGAAIVGTGGFTVSTWLKTTASATQVLVQQRSPQGYNGEYVFGLLATGHVNFWSFGGFALGPVVSSTQPINDGNWHHITVVREDDGTMRLYLDGTLDANAAGSARPLIALNVYLGADKRDNNRFLDGTLDDVRIYDRPLTAEEVSILALQAGTDFAAVGDAYVGNEDELISVAAPGLLLNDQGSGLTVTSLDSTSSLGLAVTGGADGSFSYDPSGQFEQLSIGETLTDTFAYTITDGNETDSANVTITLQGRNDSPAATSDVKSTNEDTAVDINVVNNDSDVDQLDTLSVTGVNVAGTIGSVTFAGGTVTYDPNGQFEALGQGVFASDSFTYTVSDGNGGTAIATVSITINGVNDAPVAAPNDATTDEATAIEIAVLSGDSDIDSGSLNVTAVSTAVGNVSINPDNTVTYDPNGQFDHLVAGQSTTDSFSYTITDEFSASSTALVTVTISGLGTGTAAFDDNATTDEASAVTVTVLSNDTIAGAASELVVTAVDNTGTSGVASQNPDQTISYDPNGSFEHLATGQTATDTFVYSISDGIGGSGTATVTVTVQGVNDPPSAEDDQYSVIAGNVLNIAAPGVLANDSDVDSITTTTTGFLFAAPDGSPSGDGSFAAPWDLATLFAHPPELQPGDTVYLRGGTYYGAPDSNIAGTASLPITIQSYPGEQARIDVYAPATFGEDRIIGMFGDYVHWVDLEFMSSDPHSRITDIPSHGYPDINRGTLSVQGSHNKFINDIFHDMESGIGFWSEGTGGEIYGAIVYNNGWVGPDRNHGHGIYTQNELGTKRIADSIIFNQFSHGIHAYGTSLAHLKGLNIEGNVSFNNGAGSGQGFIPSRDILIGGGSRAENVRLANNYTYQNNGDGVIGFGFLQAPENDNIEIVDNYFVGEVTFYSAWEDVTYTGNTNYNANNILVSLESPAAGTIADYTWDHNEYFTPFDLQFRIDGENHWFESWQATTGLDPASTYTSAAPSGVEVSVRPNEYEAGRGNVIVYNWDLAANVDVDLSTVLQVGDVYEIRNAVEVSGAPLITGVFDGNPVTLPMSAVVAPSPIGYTAQSPVGTGPDFGVFIVTTPTPPAVGEALSVTSFDALSTLGATVSVSSSGSFVYDAGGLPAVALLGANEILVDTFTYTTSDAEGASDTATVTVTISGENHPPIANDDSRSTSEDVAITIDVLANDDDTDTNDSISLLSVDGSSALATVTIANDMITYDPRIAFNSLAVGETAVETLTYTIVDGFEETDTATVTITVHGVNDAPTAEDDNASTDEASAITIAVLANDTDPDVSETAINVQRVAAGLANPIFVTAAAGHPDQLFIAEQSGQIKILDLQTLVVSATPFLTISDLSYNDGGVRGLLGLAFHPDYATNRLFYVYMTDVNQDSLIRQYEANLDGLTADPASATPILSIPQIDKYHYGGWIGFGPNDGLLHIASGDGGPSNDTDLDAQDVTDNLRGKILRIDVNGDDFPADPVQNYAIPPGNPFVGLSADDEILAYGLRNPWRVSFDRLTGDLYIGDVGQNAREEVSVLPASSAGGLNFGWRAREGTISNPAVSDPDPPAAIDPIYDYLQGTGPREGFSVTGGYVYRGPIQELQGNYFFADFVSEQVWSLKFNGDSPAAFDGTNFTDFIDWTDVLTADVGEVNLISSFGEDALGNLYIVDYGGEVFRITSGNVAEQLTVQSVDVTGTVSQVQINPDGTISYDPNGQFEQLGVGQSATDSFTYLISDASGGTDSATVQLTITGVNDPPQAASDAAATNEDTPLSIQVLQGDTDVDQLDVLSLQSINAAAAEGNVTIGPNNTVTYDPSGQFDHLAVGQFVLDTFTYTITDGNGGSDSAVVTVTVNGVNDAPRAVHDSVTVNEDSATLIQVLAGDSDPDDSDVLTVIGVDDTNTLGLVTLNPDGSAGYNATGRFDYLAVGTTFQDTFRYTIQDAAGATATGTVSVTITGINDEPLPVDDAASTDERSALSIAVLAGDSDPDNGDILTVVGIDDALTLGSVRLEPDGTVTYDPNGQFNALDAGQTATDSFAYQISDGNGGLQWGNVVLSINGLDSPPAPIDGLIAYWPLDDGGGNVAQDESGNDYVGKLGGNPVWSEGNLDGGLAFDGLGDNIDAGLGPAIVGTGGFTVAAWVRSTATQYQVIVQQRSIREFNGEYMFHLNAFGQVGFWTFGGLALGPSAASTQPVNDGDWHHLVGVREDNGTMKIYVDGVLDGSKAGAPRPLVPINVYVGADMRGSSRFFDGTLDDVRIYDRSLDPQEVEALFLYRPEVDSGIGIDDSYGTDEDSSLSVPVPGVLSNDVGLGLAVSERDTFSSAGILVTGGTDGSFQYASAGQFESLADGEVLLDTFTYTVTDGTLTDTATVSISITGVNDAPVADDDNASTDEATQITIAVLPNDADVDDTDILRIDAVQLAGTLGLVSQNPDGTLQYDPNGAFESLGKNESATDTLGYTVGDGNGGADSGVVSITIQGLNDTPIARADAANTNEETQISIAVLTNDSDVDANDILTILTVDDAAAVGSIILNPDHTITYNPDGQFDDLVQGETAIDTFTYTVSDGNGGTASTSVTVSIAGVGIELAAVNDNAETLESGSVIVDVLDNDLDGGSLFGLTISALGLSGTVGSVQENQDETLTYDPSGQFESLAVGETATDTFTYTVDDGLGGSDIGTVTVTVQGENDAPIAYDDDLTTNEDTPITIAVLANDQDLDLTDVLSIQSIDDNATLGNVTVQPDGTLRYDPAGQFEHLAAGDTATDTFLYTSSDGHGGTDSAIVVVTIEGADESSVLIEGLLAHWALDDGAGTVAEDLSGNGHHGVVRGNPVWSSGIINGGLQFDGLGDHVDAGLGPSIVGTGGFTVAAWVRTSSIYNQVIIQQRSATEFNGEYQLHVASGRVRFWTVGGLAYGPIVVSSQFINDGDWHHVVGVREDDGTTKIYIDGTIDGSKAGVPRPLIPIKVYVGADMRGSSAFFQGSLDEVRIYDRALTPGDVLELANYQMTLPNDPQAVSFAGSTVRQNGVEPQRKISDADWIDEIGVQNRAVPGLQVGATTLRTKSMLEPTSTANRSSAGVFDDEGFLKELSDKIQMLCLHRHSTL